MSLYTDFLLEQIENLKKDKEKEKNDSIILKAKIIILIKIILEFQKLIRKFRG